MKWFKNSRINVKLLVGFGIVILISAILSVYSIMMIYHVDSLNTEVFDYPVKRMEYLLEAQNDVTGFRRILTAIALNVGDSEAVNARATEVQQTYERINEYFNNYLDSVNSDPSLSDAEKSERTKPMQDLSSLIEQYKVQIADDMIKTALAGDAEGAKKATETGASFGSSISTGIADLTDVAQHASAQGVIEVTNQTIRTITLQIVISLLSVVFALTIAVLIANAIKKPILELVEAAGEIAKGNMNVNIRSQTKDEIGELGRSFSEVVENINKIIRDIDGMYKLHENEGDMDARIDVSGFEGSYKDMTTGINQMIASYVDMVNDVFRVMGAVGEGDFATQLKKIYEGKKKKANDEIANLRNRVVEVSNEIQALSTAGAAGELSIRSDVSRFKGEWAGIIVGLNSLMNAVVEPINESIGVIVEMSQGNFSMTVKGNYQGQFLTIKESLNNTVNAVSSYITEINKVLSEISRGDLRGGISREYVGQFSSMKDSLNTILESLNKTMKEIDLSSDQVLAGARQISESAMTLAEGASEQASAIQQLTASIETINEQTQTNSGYSSTANELSAMSAENAKRGNTEMKNMLVSMDGIKESSNNISKIIKVIEDIAFQTNLLALNAAVEAARAGDHGKGFAVVAEEVRNLAGRSQAAAKETTALIEGSITKVNGGTDIANETALSLDKIVSSADEVSDIISHISESSSAQAEAIGQVSIGVNQISQVVQNNSSTSEESAAAAEELNSQAEMLRQMVSFFKVK